MGCALHLLAHYNTGFEISLYGLEITSEMLLAKLIFYTSISSFEKTEVIMHGYT